MGGNMHANTISKCRQSFATFLNPVLSFGPQRAVGRLGDGRMRGDMRPCQRCDANKMFPLWRTWLDSS